MALDCSCCVVGVVRRDVVLITVMSQTWRNCIRIARNFGGQNFGGFAKNRFLRLIFWRIVAKADIHAHVYPILAVKILAFREQSAKILTTKISRYTVASMGESCRASCVLHFLMLIVAICINAIERAM